MRQHLAKTKIAFEDKLVRLVLLGSVVPLCLGMILLIHSDVSVYLKILLVFLVFVSIGYTAFAVRRQVIFQLRTSTNLVEAMTSGDYSLRANNSEIDGALADFNQLLNDLATRLAEQSLITREKQILLTKVTNQIDVAIVAVDHKSNISLMNPTAERLFKKRFDELQGWPIRSLGLHEILVQAQQKGLSKVTEFEINQNKRKVYVRTDTYFELGQQHHLIFITDIQHLLRDEERLAWQKLLRVLSHEINNSLTPIASISETLGQIVSASNEHQAFSQDTRGSLIDGLAVVTERAHALNHFIQDYQQLTRLPLPTKTLFSLNAFFQAICQLFENSEVSMQSCDIKVFADSEQLQQVFVNLLKNAQEANLAAGRKNSHIIIEWRVDDNMVHIAVIDQGLGINNADNIFVPFYTTKKQGSGIGLTLSRQIVLNHGGDLSLVNSNATDQKAFVKAAKKGAKATVILPMASDVF